MLIRKILASALIAMCALATAAAQGYDVPEVKISKDKVKVNGRSCYAHVVTEKQTLYSICKAYDVSAEDIYAANANLKLKEEGLKVGQVLLIPVQETVQESVPAEIREAPAADTVSDTSRRAKSVLSRWLFPGKARQRDTTAFEFDVPSRIKVALMLPFSNSRTGDNAADFYAGALLAARDLGKSGIDLDINAVDIRDSATISSFVLSAYDVIIGPIATKDMKQMLAKCPEDKFIISPLDPQAAPLAEEYPSIQAPTPVQIQNEEVVEWALRDMAPADSLVLLTSRGSRKPSAGATALIETLKASGRHYHRISYDIHDGASIQRAFMAHASAHGTTRYIIADDEESFVSDAIRNINLMVFKKYDVALYAPSRVRSFSYIEAENLHNISTHVCTAYFTDYSNNTVTDFVMAYRALFGAEPNSFAFHGYDVLHYFANICRLYGRQWPKQLENYRENGLQTNFSFARDEEGVGFVNHAVRRIVYTPDFQLQLR